MNINTNEIMYDAKTIVETICNMESIGCRSLNKTNEALKLFELVGIDANKIKIVEIPCDWDNNVCIIFKFENEYYELYVGEGCNHDGFYFEFAKDDENRIYGVNDDEYIMPLEFFLNDNIKMRQHIAQAQDGIAYLFPYVDSKTLDILIDMCQTLDEIKINLCNKKEDNYG